MKNIFCSVGTQAPFDRLVEYLLRWAEGKDVALLVQAGDSLYVNQHEFVVSSISGDEFTRFFDAADVVVSHAGMGNIIRALELSKPIVLLPRLASHGEHVNDHQVDTAERFSGSDLVSVVSDYSSFEAALDACLNSPLDIVQDRRFPEREYLHTAIERFVNGEELFSLTSVQTDISAP